MITIDYLPIMISVFSVFLAAFAIGWNIYRDVVLKAKVRVSFAIVNVLDKGEMPKLSNTYLKIAATNFGPNVVKIEMIASKASSMWRRLFWQVQHFVVLDDQTNPLNPQLPYKLDISETLTILLPYEKDCLLDSKVTHVGFTDSYGRFLFASRNSVRRAKKKFLLDYDKILGINH